MFIFLSILSVDQEYNSSCHLLKLGSEDCAMKNTIPTTQQTTNTAKGTTIQGGKPAQTTNKPAWNTPAAGKTTNIPAGGARQQGNLGGKTDLGNKNRGTGTDTTGSGRL